MSFTSGIFLFAFFPLFLCLYFMIKSGGKKYLFLLASAVFFGWASPESLLVIALFIAANYIFGICIEKGETTGGRKILFIFGICLDIALLIYYKYAGFFLETVNEVSGAQLSLGAVIAPMGISYFTFSGISYLADVYRKENGAEKNIIHFSLYIGMFPKIIAGPIVRYKEVREQLNCSGALSEQTAEGIRRFCFGLAKKVLIADQLGSIADEIFQLPPNQNLTATAWLGILCYSLQIYYDFSGYSDMALGIGKMCGFDFKENFNYPYTADSIAGFWRRWHISLSLWFRDYLYIPMGGNRTGNVYVHTLLVFLATGFWHGASWGFVFWGLWHGLFVMAERFGKKHFSVCIPRIIRHIYTLFVVLIGWVFFRCGSFMGGAEYIKSLFGIGESHAGFTLQWYLSPKIMIIILAALLFCMPVGRVIGRKIKRKTYLNIVCLILLALSMAAVMSNSYQTFIYFKF